MRSSTSEYEFFVLVKNKPITEYSHQGKTYVEGRDGSNYTLRLRNNTARRVLFVPSIDGLSILDGKLAGEKSTGYVVNAFQTIDIEGWKVDSETAAKFQFRTKEKSYSSEMGQGVDNVGIIGCRVYREKIQFPVIHQYHVKSVVPSYNYGGGWSDSPVGGSGWSMGGQGMAGGALRSASYTASLGASGEAQSAFASASLNNMATATASLDSLPQNAADPIEQSLGTAFGQATEFRTTTVEFEKANPHHPDVEFQIRYDSRRNLEKMGIQISKKKPAEPNAFPADKGCTPPKGWNRKVMR